MDWSRSANPDHATADDQDETTGNRHPHGRVFVCIDATEPTDIKGMRPMHDQQLQETAAKVAKMLAFYCVRNSALEDLHAGVFPSSQTGDYRDVNVVSPYGEIAWNRLSRISDAEMKPLMQEIVNRLYTFVYCLLAYGEPAGGVPLPKRWSAPELHAEIAQMWDLETTP
jgi:hypothetical protein